jgi:uncharacterized protein (DUF302 family)
VNPRIQEFYGELTFAGPRMLASYEMSLAPPRAARRSGPRTVIQKWKGCPMTYYFSRTLPGGFDRTVEHVIEALKNEGFGIITEIDVQETLKKKINVDFRRYRILGACNPKLAYEALQLEDKVGAMLPCNVVVQDVGDGKTEVAAIDPVASMMAIDNPRLREAAAIVQEKLKKVVAAL